MIMPDKPVPADHLPPNPKHDNHAGKFCYHLRIGSVNRTILLSRLTNENEFYQEAKTDQEKQSVNGATKHLLQDTCPQSPENLCYCLHIFCLDRPSKLLEVCIQLNG